MNLHSKIPRIEISGSNRLEQLPPVPINISESTALTVPRNTNLFSSSAQRVNALVNDHEFLRMGRGWGGRGVEIGRQSECEWFCGSRG